MVRNYKRKMQQGSWNIDSLRRAVRDIKEKKLSTRRASERYGIPRGTLHRHVFDQVKKPGKLGRFHTVFPIEYEKKLKIHILDLEKRLYGVTVLQMRRMAYELAEKLGLPHPFNKEKRLAGLDFVQKFIKRVGGISIRNPEAVSISRAVGFNKPKVKEFYDVLEKLYTENIIAKENIWNADESGISTVHTPGKILARKGQKQVGKITSGEKGKTVTILCAMNSVGSYIPPMMIFPRKRFPTTLLKGAPPGTVGAASDNGWINIELFQKWLNHFISHIKPDKTSKFILIIDGHRSHITLSVVDMCKENNIELLCLPPHCTHKMQPLDLTFFSSLKSLYNREADKWMLSNPGKRISFYEVAELFGNTYLSSATMSKGIEGFKKAGIIPFNPDIFTEEEFQPSLVTEQIEIVDLTPNETVVTEENGDVQPEENGDVQPEENGNVQPEENGDVQPEENGDVSSFTDMLFSVSPLPKADLRGPKRKINTIKIPVLLTSPEYISKRTIFEQKAQKETKKTFKNTKKSQVSYMLSEDLMVSYVLPIRYFVILLGETD